MPANDLYNLRKLIKRCKEMDITEQLNIFGDAILPMEAEKELQKLLDILYPPSTHLIRIHGRRAKVVSHGVYDLTERQWVPVDHLKNTLRCPILVEVVK